MQNNSEAVDSAVCVCNNTNKTTKQINKNYKRETKFEERKKSSIKIRHERHERITASPWMKNGFHMIRKEKKRRNDIE